MTRGDWVVGLLMVVISALIGAGSAMLTQRLSSRDSRANRRLQKRAELGDAIHAFLEAMQAAEELADPASAYRPARGCVRPGRAVDRHLPPAHCLARPATRQPRTRQLLGKHMPAPVYTRYQRPASSLFACFDNASTCTNAHVRMPCRERRTFRYCIGSGDQRYPSSQCRVQVPLTVSPRDCITAVAAAMAALVSVYGCPICSPSAVSNTPIGVSVMR